MVLDFGVYTAPSREDDGTYVVEITPEPGAVRKAMVHHLVVAHPDDTIELDGGDRRIADLTDEEWSQVFAGEDEAQAED